MTAPLRRLLSSARSSLLARNIIANMFGRAWMMFMSFAFVPVYIHLLGIEAYGVIGLYATLMVLFSVLDFGLSVTLNREMARMVAIESEHARMPDLVRTLELLYWVIGIGIGMAVVVAAPYLARHWLHPAHISIPTLEATIRLIGLTAALQWPTGLYGGGIAGLQQFVRSNVIDIIVSTLRGVGGVVTIWLFSRSLEAYFVWQVVATTIGLLLMRRLLWRSLPLRVGRPRVDPAMLAGLWRFSAGMTFISLLAIVTAQSDKVILSNAVPLALYAKYLLAAALAGAANIVLSMIVPTIFPQLSQAVLVKTGTELATLYHRFCQLMTLSIAPIAMTVAAFSYEIILFWTRDATIAVPAAPIATILTLGTLFSGLFQVPYLLQLGNGSTRASLVANVVTAVLVVPLIYGLTRAFGAPGAAAAIALMAAAQLFVVAPYIQHRFLPGSTMRWLVEDIGLPSLVAAGTAFGLHALMPPGLTITAGFVLALAAGGVSLVLTLLCLPIVRSAVLQTLTRRLHVGTA